jgi:hypothetical protein
VHYTIPYDSPLTQQIEYLQTRGLIEHAILKPYDSRWLTPQIDRLLISDIPLTRIDRRAISLLSPMIGKNDDFSFLLHLGGAYSRKPELYGGFLDYRAGGTLFKNLRFSHAMRFDRSSEVDSLGPKPWKGFQVYMTEGLIDFDIHPVRFFIGRRNSLFGQGEATSMLLSLDKQGYDGFGLHIPLRYLEFHTIFAVLDAQEERYLAIHRLGFRLQNIVSLGFSEALLFGGTLEPLYLNFLLPYYLTQWGTYRDDNVLWFCDIRFRIFETELYGELLIDDYMFEDDPYPNKLGWRFGAESCIMNHFLINARYTFVDKWVYTQRSSINAYERDGYPLGFPLGNDVDQTRLSIRYLNALPLSPVVTFEYSRKGEGSIYLPYEEEGGDWNPPFPSGIVQHTLDIRLGMDYAFRNNLYLHADIGRKRIQNAVHVQGADTTETVFSTSLWIVY